MALLDTWVNKKTKKLKVQGWQIVPKGSRLVEGTSTSKVGKRYQKFQGWQKVHVI